MEKRRREGKPRNHERTAVVALTSRGARLARAVAEELGEADLYLPARLRSPAFAKAAYFQPPLSSLIPRLYSDYRRLVFFCALGLVVRAVAPLLRGKEEDPAVVVVDEAGWNVISVLSGHYGGANQLTRRIADLLGANPVITTASDLNGIPALDEICRKRGWKMENPRLLPPLATALMEGEEVAICSDLVPELEVELGEELVGFRLLPLDSLARLPRNSWKVALTDRILRAEAMDDRTLVIRPRRLVAGLGFHRGVDASRLREYLEQALMRAGLSLKGVGIVATLDRRAGERGICELADELGAELRVYGPSELEDIAVPSPPSLTSLRWTGIPGVCERVALAASEGGRLLVPKTKFREVAVAVAEKAQPEGRKRGKLSLVGIGPGDPELIPPRARRALFTSEVILGYKGYINRITGMLGPAEAFSFGMGQERSRLLAAISLARLGKKVCLVSGGDPGIYGMAAVLGDLLLSGTVDIREVDVEVIPGIPAHCAAASLLGSPLACDFAVISLSDYLVERDRILDRVEACAASDLVIVLYNPASSKRSLLKEATNRILRHRSPKTPVALVRNAWRKGGSVRILNLEALGKAEADMNTLVIVGNSETSLREGWMVTPRGYQRKEEGNG